MKMCYWKILHRISDEITPRFPYYEKVLLEDVA